MNEPLLPCNHKRQISFILSSLTHITWCPECGGLCYGKKDWTMPEISTPPPASMKFPEDKKVKGISVGGKGLCVGFWNEDRVDGWNLAIKACKELNAPNVRNNEPNSILDWFTTKNPLLGNVSPIDMIKNGRQDKLCKWILNQIEENVPKLEQSGYATETPKLNFGGYCPVCIVKGVHHASGEEYPKFTEEQKGNIMDRSKIIIRLMSGIFGLTHDQAEVVADWHISEMNTKPSEKKESEDYCAETVMVADNTSEVQKLAALIRGVIYTDGWVPDVIANEIINAGWKKEGKDG